MNILHNEQRLKEGCIKKRRKRIQRALEGEDIQNKKKRMGKTGKDGGSGDGNYSARV